ncbi:hypothetical protein [Streptomyces sp. S186]|uniref:hypothetical protein n=1 Tax=Streptomyces sp. S186 TaxID=3434395 RepID=UPI003F674FAF
MSTENTVQNSGERDVVGPRDSHQPIVTPRDSHQPILGPGATPQVPQPRDREVVRPMDSHQPSAASDAGTAEAPAGATDKTPARDKNITTMDSHQPVGGVK